MIVEESEFMEEGWIGKNDEKNQWKVLNSWKFFTRKKKKGNTKRSNVDRSFEEWFTIESWKFDEVVLGIDMNCLKGRRRSILVFLRVWKLKGDY